MKAYICDVCKEFTDFSHTFSGDVSRRTIGWKTKYYPDAYQLCSSCADELQEVINLWLNKEAKV